MRLKEVLKFLQKLNEQGVWLIPLHAFVLRFSEEKNESIARELNNLVKDDVIIRIANGLYANLNARSMPGRDYALIQVAKKLRPHDKMYLSLDARANELGLVLQVPNRLTFVTDGRSYVYKTPIGIIEFVHKDISKDINEMEGIEYDKGRDIYVASKERTIEDTKRHKRTYLIGQMEENR
jgi:hypothetical protein